MFAILSEQLQRAVATVGLIYFLLTIALFAAVALFVMLMVRAGRRYFRFRREQAVICPTTQTAASVCVDARHAALSSLWLESQLRITACSHWTAGRSPSCAACRMQCLPQLERDEGFDESVIGASTVF